MSIPRPEYPRPQYERADWLNLNGPWAFQRDPGRSGRARGLAGDAPYDEQITVPFCPESRLSGLGYTDFMPAVWYRRTVTLPEAWAGRRVLLHFGAVDYDTEVWVNGTAVGTHRGGYVGFTFDITAHLQPGENVITVCAEDDVRSPLQPSGKQSHEYGSHGCHYTRTTGIWQTVWLEAVPQRYLGRPKITPDLEAGCAYVEVPIIGDPRGLTLQVAAFLDDERMVAQVKSVPPSGNLFRVRLDLSEVRSWSPESPTLYRLELVMTGGETDTVHSYFGLRSITLAGPAVLLDGKPVYQRLILDQGFYPDGIYTAPSDDALRGDIEMSMAMGFNGARLHEKVFEERFLYWADKLGYLVWGEMANWGLDISLPPALERFQTEWLEVLARDASHPSLVGWCPFNETSWNQNPEVLRQIYLLTKAIDPTRPVIDTSGYIHVVTDIFDVHDYEQDPATFAAHYADGLHNAAIVNGWNRREIEPAPGQPYFVSEYGGIWWNPGQVGTAAWGYGNRPQSEEEFLTRFRGLTEALLNHPGMCAFCYTQLTDVEQEVNGLYTYDRQAKFPPETIKAIVAQKAAIEV
jgi:beta-galactosidase/beta-glucuronidase